jgi:micrococcal nuclease
VVDGDTIKVRLEGEEYTLRYIGIDAPETVHPDRPVEPMGPEAAAANASLVEGQSVFLERDLRQADRYGRLLRYVYLPDGTMVNEELVRLGYALSSSYPPDVRYQDRLVAAQQEAREAGRGLWGLPTATPTLTRTPSPRVAMTLTPGQGCHSSYPDFCIPPPPPDLDCKHVSGSRFRVTGSDPHGFDGDGDGIGCE